MALNANYDFAIAIGRTASAAGAANCKGPAVPGARRLHAPPGPADDTAHGATPRSARLHSAGYARCRAGSFRRHAAPSRGPAAVARMRAVHRVISRVFQPHALPELRLDRCPPFSSAPSHGLPSQRDWPGAVSLPHMQRALPSHAPAEPVYTSGRARKRSRIRNGERAGSCMALTGR